jgi:hypothetical protein
MLYLPCLGLEIFENMTVDGGPFDGQRQWQGRHRATRVREIPDAARGLSHNANVRELAAVAPIAIAEPLGLLPRRRPHEPS